VSARVPRMVAASLEQLRLSLPLDDPDRHDLDVEADERFAALAPGRPDLGASVAAGFEPPIEWGEAPVYPPRPGSVGCEPEFAASRGVADVETGGAL
jgi:hypothetical protein